MDVSFGGFPPETLRFLRDLGANNSKEWFTDNRDRYQVHFLEPAMAFVAAMSGPLQKLCPDVHCEPRVNGSIFRINRDVRFSTDKTPYKDHLDLFFWIGEGRSRERPGFFFRLRPDTLHTGAGMHGFDPARLKAFRGAVIEDRRGGELEAAIAAAQAAGADPQGEGYKRVPAGLDPDHPRARLLRFKALHAGFEEPVADVVHGPGLVDHCVARFRPLAPLARWVAAL